MYPERQGYQAMRMILIKHLRLHVSKKSLTPSLQTTGTNMIIKGIKAFGLRNCPLSPFKTYKEKNQFMSCLFGTPNVISHFKMCFMHSNLATGDSKLFWKLIHPQRMKTHHIH